MQKGAMKSILDNIKLEKVANSSNFYRIFIEAIPPKISNHELILKIFLSYSTTFKITNLQIPRVFVGFVPI